MMKKKLWMLGLFFGLLLSSCSFFQTGQQAEIYRSARCIPSFPDQDGWYGADGAYSIALDERRTLWLFGDTFASNDEGRRDRIGMDIIWGTTLAVSTCKDNASFNIRYYLKKKNGTFVSSFGNGEWLWPQDPFIAEGILYIPLLLIEALPDAQPPFNFRIAGHKIAKIKNYDADDPNSWPVVYLDWTQALPPGFEALATTSVVYGSYVYFYPLYRHRQTPASVSGNILARIAVRHLEAPINHLEYWTKNHVWSKALDPATIRIIFPAGVSELSVRYHADEKRWVAVYLSPENKGERFFYASAPSLEGPWSASAALGVALDEVNPASSLYDRHTFCYAGKEHRQFAQNQTLVVTYVCNSSESPGSAASFLRKNLFLYRPVVKIIRR